MNLIRALVSQLRETQALACGSGCGCPRPNHNIPEIFNFDDIINVILQSTEWATLKLRHFKFQRHNICHTEIYTSNSMPQHAPLKFFYVIKFPLDIPLWNMQHLKFPHHCMRCRKIYTVSVTWHDHQFPSHNLWHMWRSEIHVCDRIIFTLSEPSST